MNNRIKVIYSDIDGTLLNSQHRISLETEKAIKRLQANGISFVLASSRGPMAIDGIFRRYGFTCPMISFGGALLLDEKGKIMEENPLEKRKAQDFVSYLEKEIPEVTYNLYTSHEWFVKDTLDPRVKKEEEIVEAKAAPFDGNIDNIGDIDKILLMTEEGKAAEIAKRLKTSFPEFTISCSSTLLIEVTAFGISKGKGVLRFGSYYGFHREESMAFGDNYNDEEMLSLVSYPILMGNAPLPLKEKGYEITADNDHDGIARVLEKYGLTEEKGVRAF